MEKKVNRGGIHEQIKNEDNYGELSVEKLQKVIKDLFGEDTSKQFQEQLREVATAVNKTDKELEDIVDKEAEQIFKYVGIITIQNGRYTMTTGKKGYKDYKLVLYKTLRDKYSIKSGVQVNQTVPINS